MDRVRRLSRYRSFPAPRPAERAWPDRTLDRAPRWLSTDLRDGNQALAVPMSPRRKLALFRLLTSLGYREIEVGFPVASRDEHDFIRMLIEQDRIPDDVLISVLVPAREELIARTAASLRGARRAALHVYNATCPTFRGVVFGMSREECRDLAVRGARAALAYAEKELPGCEVRYQYSPELFNETEPEFALEVCEAVMDVWQPGPGREIVLNFPATVERATPNVFADQIEWLDRNLSRREHVCLSVHPHNDRGTAVAAAEMSVLAGAQRVEGCLFGGGERAGNVCLVTLGMNLFSQGVDPNIDFSDIDRIRAVVEECTGMRVAPRHPYAGELVYTAFSGSHQDAIGKGFRAGAAQAAAAGVAVDELPWEVPYLPVDPEDVGRGYDAVVRINSQSGKGGIAYIMNTRNGLRLPRELQADFAQHVQRLSESLGELTPGRMRACFQQEYVVSGHGPLPERLGDEAVPATVYVDGADVYGPLGESLRTLENALVERGVDVKELHIIEPEDTGAPAAEGVTAYAACWLDGRTVWGAAVHADPHQAAFAAVHAAVTRAAMTSEPIVPNPGPAAAVPATDAARAACVPRARRRGRRPARSRQTPRYPESSATNPAPSSPMNEGS